MDGTSMSRRRFLDLGRDASAFTLVAAAAPAAVFAQTNGRGKRSMSPTAASAVHGLSVSVGAGLRSETWLNGILLARTEAGEIGAQSLAIQHDMLPGGNRAELRVALAGMNLEQPPAPISGSLPAAANARLLLQMDEPHRAGDTLDITTRDVDQVLWPPADEDGPVSLPHRLTLTFAPLFPVVAPPWAEATRVLPEGIAEAVYARMAELTAMLRNGDLEAYENAGAVRREHMARSYPLGPNAEAARAQDLQLLKMMHSEPGFTATLLPSNEARYRTMAGGRLMEWTNAAGEGALTIASRGVRPSPVNMQFSLVGGNLVMTR
ncbi:hypothetical protein [Sphingomonas solaris]|uniref:Uncharacterized protein n=1 Tax=Alterirhizorhabdus solaris TaxID=2529389 RepID=A0A558QSR3_9SPHN|nr:hypothetical protein [Sphingomonas solaris]TVV70186.1 hypothetical protein FOY91_19705 [Sphingomonas solaris]